MGAEGAFGGEDGEGAPPFIIRGLKGLGARGEGRADTGEDTSVAARPREPT
jgi:hypothetical protein